MKSMHLSNPIFDSISSIFASPFHSRFLTLNTNSFPPLFSGTQIDAFHDYYCCCCCYCQLYLHFLFNENIGDIWFFRIYIVQRKTWWETQGEQFSRTVWFLRIYRRFIAEKRLSLAYHWHIMSNLVGILYWVPLGFLVNELLFKCSINEDFLNGP